MATKDIVRLSVKELKTQMLDISKRRERQEQQNNEDEREFAEAIAVKECGTIGPDLDRMIDKIGTFFSLDLPNDLAVYGDIEMKTVKRDIRTKLNGLVKAVHGEKAFISQRVIKTVSSETPKPTKEYGKDFDPKKVHAEMVKRGITTETGKFTNKKVISEIAFGREGLLIPQKEGALEKNHAKYFKANGVGRGAGKKFTAIV